MFPGAVAYTYLGYAGREAIGGGEDLIQKGLLALALLAMVAFLPRLISMIRRRPMLSVEDLKSKIDAAKVIHIVDVRTEQDYRGELGHIHQAMNIPLEELESRLDEIEDHLQDAIAIVCTTDRRSMKAAQILISHGFADVHVIRGGMTDWSRHGYPTQS
jgi:rhodanese-related sulfurtransferase